MMMIMMMIRWIIKTTSRNKPGVFLAGASLFCLILQYSQHLLALGWMTSLEESSSSSFDYSDDPLFSGLIVGHIVPIQTTSSSATSTSTSTTTTTTAASSVKKKTKMKTNTAVFVQREELTFLHIPKTGGSSVVAASIPHGLTWGDCLFADNSTTFTCSHLSRTTRPCRKYTNKNNKSKNKNNKLWNSCSKHLPIQYLQSSCDPYFGKDVFVVVRNPYDRVLSEFYYYCSRIGDDTKCQKEYIDNPVYMNQWLQQRLNKRKRKPPTCPTTNSGKNQKNNYHHHASFCQGYFDHCNHEIPQYEYVYDTRQNPPVRMVQWVLHMEDLDTEFPQLMERYGLDHVRLPKQRINQRITTTAANSKSNSNSTSTNNPNQNQNHKEDRLTVANFTRATLDLIEDVYRNDFEEFGYEKMRIMPRTTTEQNQLVLSLPPTTTTTTTTTTTVTTATPTSICFVTSNYADSIKKADRTPNATLANTPGVYHFLFTNLKALPAPIGWIVITTSSSSTNTSSSDNKPTTNLYRHTVTKSRYAKFLGWQVPEIQQYCRAVFYMDATYQTVAPVEVYQRLADRLHNDDDNEHHDDEHDHDGNNTGSRSCDWMQYRHTGRTKGGPLEELDAIRKLGKDSPEHVQATVTWLEQHAPVTVENATKWLSEMPVYLNTVLAYNPRNVQFQQLTLDFWSVYSQERTSWRDQPLWSYFVWKYGSVPQPFPEKLNYYFQNDRSARGFGGHKYYTLTTSTGKNKWWKKKTKKKATTMAKTATNFKTTASGGSSTRLENILSDLKKRKAARIKTTTTFKYKMAALKKKIVPIWNHHGSVGAAPERFQFPENYFQKYMPVARGSTFRRGQQPTYTNDTTTNTNGGASSNIRLEKILSDLKKRKAATRTKVT